MVMMRPKRLVFAISQVIILAALGSSCAVKVKPTPYQRGLDAYYGALISNSRPEDLQRALDLLERELKVAPSDVGLLSLRASAHLEFLRLDIEQSGANFDQRATLLLRDLRLLQSLVDQNGNQPPWVGARIYTMASDAILLRAISLANDGRSGENALCANLQASMLYRLATDYYIHAGVMARATESALKGKEGESLNLPAVLKEASNARDGYVNALNGLSQSEDFLGLSARAREHLLESNNLVSSATTTFPPERPTLTPRSLSSYTHTMLSQQAAILKDGSADFNDALRFAETEFKELVAAGFLSSPIRPLPDCAAHLLRNYYASISLPEMPLKIHHPGNFEQEEIVFSLPKTDLYRHEGIGALTPYMIVTVGDAAPRQVILQQPTTQGGAPGFIIRAEWTELTIATRGSTGIGTNNLVVNGEKATIFLEGVINFSALRSMVY